MEDKSTGAAHGGCCWPIRGGFGSARLEATFSGAEAVGLPWIVVLAFLRITTRPGILEHPLTGEGNWPVSCNFLLATGTFGNLTSDAHIAAMAIENGATIYSADYDFRRFPGVRHINPLVGNA